MPQIVIDASSLIILAKLQGIQQLYEVYGVIRIPPAIYEECVIAGKRLRKNDAFVIETAIAKEQITMVHLTEKQQGFAQQWHDDGILDLGECECLAYAKDTDTLVLIEERKGRIIARASEIKYIVLQVFPLHGYIQRKLSYEAATKLIDKIAVAMNTDFAIVQALKVAINTIHLERSES